MKRDYSYFCDTKGCDHVDTFSWTLEEFENLRETIVCPNCGKNMLIDISPRKVKDNVQIGNKTCLNPGLNYAKAHNGRDGRSYF